MFEQTSGRGSSRSIWKFVALGALLVGLAVLGILLWLPDDVEPEELSGVLHEGDPAYDRYRDQVQLIETEMEMGLNFARKRVVMLGGFIDNQGERTIDVVEVRVVFFNYDEPVAETVRTPLRPGQYTPPIEPHSQRAFNFYIEEIPEDWLSSHLEMSVSGLRFASD